MTEELRRILQDVLLAMPRAEVREVINDKDWTEKEGGSSELYLIVRVTEDTWSRSARRKLKSQEVYKRAEETDPTVIVTDLGENRKVESPEVVCTIQVNGSGEKGGIFIEFDWRRGRKEARGLFESLCSHVSRKVLQRWQNNS
jgi:hypothetical protein